MQVSTDLSGLQKSLDQFVVDNKRKLEHMVAMFATELASEASDNTPIGDEYALANVDSYASWYDYRQKQYGIPAEVGFHKGSWQYSENQDLQFVPAIYEKASMLDDVQYEAEVNYKLGDSFSIGSVAPAIVQLEQGTLQKRESRVITKPTLDSIQQAYAVKNEVNYNNG